jgi:hypothetical protein
VVEIAILGFLKKAVAGQEAKDSIKRRLMSFGGFGEVFDGLRLATLDEIGDAEFGDCADSAAEGGAVENASELFSFLLGHDFHQVCCRTLSRAKTEPQEWVFCGGWRNSHFYCLLLDSLFQLASILSRIELAL